MFQEIIEKLCPEENGLCVRARRAREELVFLPLSQMYGYEAPRKHIEALLSFSDAIGLQLARDFFGNGLMIGFNSAFDGRHFDFEVRGARLYVRGKEAAGGEYEKNRQAIRSRLSDLRGGVYASCGISKGCSRNIRIYGTRGKRIKKIMPLPRSTTAWHAGWSWGKDCGLMPTECATAQKKENKEPLRSASGGKTAQNRILTEREAG